MTEIKVDISELKSEGSDVIKELTDYVKEKTKAEIETATDKIVVKGEGKTASKNYVRVVLRKYLHKTELKKYFKVLGCKENTFVIKEIKEAEEEE